MNDENAAIEDVIDVDDQREAGSGKPSLFDVLPEFGMEVTNADSPNRSKRTFADLDDLSARTPVKKQKVSAKTSTASAAEELMGSIKPSLDVFN